MNIIGGPLYCNSQTEMEAREMHTEVHTDNKSITNNST